MAKQSVHQNRGLRLAYGLAMPLSVMLVNGAIIFALHGLGLDLSAPLPPTMWAMFTALAASFYYSLVETDFPAVIRASQFLRWEARVVYSALYLDTAVLFGGFNGLGPYRNSIVEALLVIPGFLAILFFVRLCMAEWQSSSNPPNP